MTTAKRPRPTSQPTTPGHRDSHGGGATHPRTLTGTTSGPPQTSSRGLPDIASLVGEDDHARWVAADQMCSTTSSAVHIRTVRAGLPCRGPSLQREGSGRAAATRERLALGHLRTAPQACTDSSAEAPVETTESAAPRHDKGWVSLTPTDLLDQDQLPRLWERSRPSGAADQQTRRRHPGTPSGGCSSTRGLYSTNWMRPSNVR